MRPRFLTIARLLAVLATAGALGACGSSASSSSTTSSATSTTSTAPGSGSTSSTTTTASGESTTSSTGPAATSSCPGSALKVSNGGASGAAGSIFTTISIVNRSAVLCTIEGRPTVTLIGKKAGGSIGPIPATVDSAGESDVFSIAPATVTLSPGDVDGAGILIESSDVPVNGETTCPVVTAVKVLLPGIVLPYSLPVSFSACGGPTIDVSAIVRADQLPPSGSGTGTGSTSGVAKPPTSGG